MTLSGGVALRCLGTGLGYSNCYDGVCSPGYVIERHGKPALLVGCGGGVVRRCLSVYGALPRALFLPNNRTAWASDLPVLLSYEAAQRRPLSLYTGDAVARRIQTCRLAELHEHMKNSNRTMDDLAHFIILEQGQRSMPLEDFPEISITVRLAVQSECSFALLVLLSGRPLLAIGCDAAIDDAFLRDMCMAPTVVLEGRESGTADHPSFRDLGDALRRVSNSRGVTQLFVGQHGFQQRPLDDPVAGLAPDTPTRLLITDDVVSLDRPASPSTSAVTRSIDVQPPPRASNDKKTPLSPTSVARTVWAEHSATLADDYEAAHRVTGASFSNRRSSPTTSPRRRVRSPTITTTTTARASSGPVPLKLWLFNNEDPQAPPRMIMAQSLRSLPQLCEKASTALQLRPLERVYHMDGRPVKGLQELVSGESLICTKIGGAPFKRIHLWATTNTSLGGGTKTQEPTDDRPVDRRRCSTNSPTVAVIDRRTLL